MTACARHPSVPAVRRCAGCSRAFCGDCIVPTLDESAAEGYGVCDECRDRVAPHQWNRFAAGLPDSAGDHLLDALVRPRRALLRAAYGELPWGGVGAVSALGFLGAAWVVLLIRHPELPGGVRFLQGFLHVWETAVIAAVFALSMHALQPSGPGSASPVGTSLGIVATAGLPFSLVALLGGVLGFAMPLFMPALLWGKIAGGVLGLSVLWGVLLSGRGIAIRRGVSPGVGATAALAGLVVSLLVLALVLWMRLNPSDIQGVTPGQF